MFNLDHTPVLAAILAVGTATLLWRAREENMYNNQRGALRWLAGGLVCGLARCAIVALVILAPGVVQQLAPNGFGPGWLCQKTPKAGKFCYRDPLKP